MNRVEQPEAYRIPGVYKEQRCPTCDRSHRRRSRLGHCSRKCAAARPKTPAQRRSMAVVTRRRNMHDERVQAGIHSALLGSRSGKKRAAEERAMKSFDAALAPRPEGEVAGGDLWVDVPDSSGDA